MSALKVLHRNLFWLWIAFIFLANVIPFSLSDFTEGKPEVISQVLKGGYILHALIMITLPWIYSVIVRNGIVLFNEFPFLKLSLIIFFISVGAEFIQMLIPNRTFNFWDVFFNLLGGFLGILLFYRKTSRNE